MATPKAQDLCTEPYLIAHLVRGEPAFDIAHRLQIGDEEGWIIPTSGHRAYPYWAEPLMAAMRRREHAPETVDIYWVSDKPALGYGTTSVSLSGWPDHYPTRATPTAQAAFAEALGLAPKPLIITRR